MSEHDKRKSFILDEFHENCEFNNNHINLREVDTNYLVGKLDDDNIFKWIKHKEIKAIIHDFYKKKNKYFVSVGIHDSKGDGVYRFIMFNLQEELSKKSKYECLNELETILHFILYNDSSRTYKFEYSDEYSNELVNEFKNVLKEVEE